MEDEELAYNKISCEPSICGVKRSRRGQSQELKQIFNFGMFVCIQELMKYQPWKYNYNGMEVYFINLQ
jgi:hypothetical protein